MLLYTCWCEKNGINMVSVLIRPLEITVHYCSYLTHMIKIQLSHKKTKLFLPKVQKLQRVGNHNVKIDAWKYDVKQWKRMTKEHVPSTNNIAPNFKQGTPQRKNNKSQCPLLMLLSNCWLSPKLEWLDWIVV